MSGIFSVKGSICTQNGCHHCCIETEMVVTHDDIDRIVENTGLLPKDFCFLDDDGIRRLMNKKAPSGPDICYFLDNKGLCSIYDIRPRGCRYYPLIWDMESHEVISDDYCPHHLEFTCLITDAIKREIEDFIFSIYGDV